MESQHYVGEVAQKAVIKKGGQVLVVMAPGEDKWDLPGGRIHKDEKPALGLMREIKEELGVDVEVENPFFASMWRQSSSTGEGGKDRYFVAFACALKEADAAFTLQAEEIQEVKWIGKEEVDAVPLYEICKDALRTYFNKQ